jgi:hypothetical protein
MLVMLEQFAGVAYLAVVVSRLIGMTLVNQRRPASPEPARPRQGARGDTRGSVGSLPDR